MLPIIVFALFVGIIIAILGKRVETVHRLFEQFNEIMMKMTTIVMSVAPFGVFCILARTFSNIGFDAFLPMLKYMGSVVLGLGVQCFGVYMLLLVLFTRLNPFMFVRKFFPVMAFAFSTATSNATIPLNISTLEKRLGVSRRVSSFTIPLGATINMDGTAIMQGVAAVFTAQIFGIPLGPAEYATVIATATLASIGTAGVPSVGLVTLSTAFNSVGLPLEGIALIMGIDRVLDIAAHGGEHHRRRRGHDHCGQAGRCPGCGALQGSAGHARRARGGRRTAQGGIGWRKLACFEAAPEANRRPRRIGSRGELALGATIETLFCSRRRKDVQIVALGAFCMQKPPAS